MIKKPCLIEKAAWTISSNAFAMRMMPGSLPASRGPAQSVRMALSSGAEPGLDHRGREITNAGSCIAENIFSDKVALDADQMQRRNDMIHGVSAVAERQQQSLVMNFLAGSICCPGDCVDQALMVPALIVGGQRLRSERRGNDLVEELSLPSTPEASSSREP